MTEDKKIFPLYKRLALQDEASVAQTVQQVPVARIPHKQIKARDKARNLGLDYSVGTFFNYFRRAHC